MVVVMECVGFSNVRFVISEIGWLIVGVVGFNGINLIVNVKIYNMNFIKYIFDRKGILRRFGVFIFIFIFVFFNENLKFGGVVE